MHHTMPHDRERASRDEKVDRPCALGTNSVLKQGNKRDSMTDSYVDRFIYQSGATL